MFFVFVDFFVLFLLLFVVVFLVVVFFWYRYQICLLKQFRAKKLSNNIQISNGDGLITEALAFLTLLVPYPGVVLDSEYLIVLAPGYLVVKVNQAVVRGPLLATLFLFMNCALRPAN